LSSLVYTSTVNLCLHIDVGMTGHLSKAGLPMGLSERIDAAVEAAIRRGQGADAPDRLSSALHYAVTPGGARIRPTILTSVALACGDDRPRLTDAAAAALELIHCASLVHDDLPMFDDADLRRGKPAVHRAYSEPLALLTGDSLIVLAFDTLADAAGEDCRRALGLVQILAQRTGMPRGICAGQGWESETTIDLGAYHRAKTGALFIAATQMGAVAAGQEADQWEELGARIGEAFQVADDLRDALCGAEELGKPAGQDDLHGRPNAVRQLGVRGALARLDDILAGAIASIPACPGEAALAQMVRAYADRIVPATARSRGVAVPGE
jgi:geranylgeranyl diphosphate synthase type II